MVCEEQHAAYQPMEDVGRMDALQYLGAVAPVLEAEGEWAVVVVVVMVWMVTLEHCGN